MLYIMLAYLMLFTALFNAVFSIIHFLPLTFLMILFSCFVFGLLIHSSFIKNVISYHMQYL